MLEDDPEWRGRAEEFSRKVVDLSEILPSKHAQKRQQGPVVDVGSLRLLAKLEVSLMARFVTIHRVDAHGPHAFHPPPSQLKPLSWPGHLSQALPETAFPGNFHWPAVIWTDEN